MKYLFSWLQILWNAFIIAGIDSNIIKLRNILELFLVFATLILTILNINSKLKSKDKNNEANKI